MTFYFCIYLYLIIISEPNKYSLKFNLILVVKGQKYRFDTFVQNICENMRKMLYKYSFKVIFTFYTLGKPNPSSEQLLSVSMSEQSSY